MSCAPRLDGLAGLIAYLTTLLEPVVAFVHVHANWAVPLAFVLTFLKSLAFVSLVVPSTLFMLAMGSLISAAGVSFVPTWLAVSVGAALGDWVSYSIGYRVKDRARTIWPFSRRPDILPRGERFFRKWGALSVVLCRFFSPLRATVPLLCGVFEMPALTFQAANWCSAFLWAAALLGPAKMLADWLA